MGQPARSRWATSAWAPPLEGTAALAGLVVGIAALVARLRGSTFPDPWAELMADGVPAVVAVLALLLVARLVYARLRWIGFLVPVLLVLNGLSVVFDLPRLLTAESGAGDSRAVTESLASTVLAVLMIVLVGKVLLLHRFAGAPPLRPFESPPLLPSQHDDLRELESLIEAGLRGGGKVIPIMGGQGQGKSFVLRHLVAEWHNDPAKPVLAYVDVWQQQTEVDLQVGIIEALLRQPKTLQRWRWLTRVPVSFLFARPLAHLQNSATVVKVKLQGRAAGGLEADFRPPRLNWQVLYERISAGRPSVVVLDEVDRSTPEVAQAALTLARRSVDIPGVTVLLPYIRELVRYKVFNPAGPTLPDLATSMEAVLFPQTEIGPPAPTPLSPMPLSLMENSPGATASPPAPLPSDRLRNLLTERFLTATRDDRDYFQGLFEEKYLGPEGIRMHRLKPRDLCAMLLDFPTLCASSKRLLGEDPVSEAARERLQSALDRGYRRHVESLGIPSVRGLQGHLHALVVSAARGSEGRTGPVEPEALAALGLIALDHTARYYRSPPENP